MRGRSAQRRFHPRRQRSGAPWLRWTIALLFLLGLVRGGAIVLHQPLLAYANSFDEVRYTACFDLYPDRPREIPVTDNSPWAPFSHYAFIASDQPMCYWSSELLPQALVVLAYRVDQRLNDSSSFSVRWLGGLKLGLLLALNLALTRAWWRRGLPAIALLNAALLPLLLTDPANTLYMNTFYAEWTALLALYATLSLTLLQIDRPFGRRAAALLALAALALGLSKIQHLLLPLALAAGVLAVGWWFQRRWAWQGLALLGGGMLALMVQVVQLQRANPMMAGIHQANAADVVLTGLLPASDNPALTLAALGIAPQCLAYNGQHAWELPNFDPEAACPGIGRFNRRTELAFLLGHPTIALRFARNGVDAMDSWLNKDLGTVEGGGVDPLPQEFPSLGRILLRDVRLRLLLFVAPLIGLAALCMRRRNPGHALAVHFSALTSMTMLSTFAITILGDGLADTAKQGHLIFNVALGWNLTAMVVLLAWSAEWALKALAGRSPAPQPQVQ